jgi:hypothetical protein
MACPLFLPTSSLAGTPYFNGRCSDDAETPLSIEKLRSCCNPGYARGVCRQASHSETDAFRFLVKTSRHGVTEVAWSAERDHRPVAVGTLILTEGTQPSECQPLEHQARACAMTLLRP